MRLPTVLQSERNECGLASLVMIARHHGHQLDLPALRRRFPEYAPTLRCLINCADAIGLLARPLRLSRSELRRLKFPAVLHWEFDHFVVATNTGRRCIVVNDPAAGRRRLSWAEVDRGFTGVAIEFSKMPGFTPATVRGLPSIKGLWRSFRGLRRYPPTHAAAARGYAAARAGSADRDADADRRCRAGPRSSMAAPRNRRARSRDVISAPCRLTASVHRDIYRYADSTRKLDIHRPSSPQHARPDSRSTAGRRPCIPTRFGTADTSRYDGHCFARDRAKHRIAWELCSDARL